MPLSTIHAIKLNKLTAINNDAGNAINSL
ncbi:hypothetical protein D043_3775A, partial [Vibrio parahaemolyticus EKP-021]